MRFDFELLCSVCKGIWAGKAIAGAATGICTDSRIIKDGEMFVALRGQRFDGHDHVMAAFETDAAGVIAAEIRPEWFEYKDKAVIQVDDTLSAYQDIAAYYRRQLAFPVIGVTGSVGKTMTKDLLGECLQPQYIIKKTECNFNNDIGVPLTILSFGSETEVGIVEMGMRAEGEIFRLTQIAKPTVAVITNVEPVHLETLGTLDNIARAKCEIMAAEPEFAIINGDYEPLLAAAQAYNCTRYTFGYGSFCDFRLDQTKRNDKGMYLKFYFFEEPVELFFPVFSSRLAGNIVAAAAVARLMEVPWDSIQQGLINYTPPSNRLNIEYKPEGGILVNDTYNANPVSMQAALETVCQIKSPGRWIAVLGDMYELGDYTKTGHLVVGRSVVENQADLLITVGINAAYIAEGALSAGMPPASVYHFQSKDEAAEFLESELNPQDKVLFKASRGMELESLLKVCK